MDELSRILIVDDELHNIKVLSEILRGEYKIMAAKNGDQALKVVEREVLPDLILLDIIMPGIDGYEVCKRLKENPKTKNIPIIFVTAVSEIEDAAKGFLAGAVDFIQKPLCPAMVKARVELHIKLHKTMQELKDALSEVKKLSGIVPICIHCKQIRNDKGYWKQLEKFIEDHSEAKFSHSCCDSCLEKYYPEEDDE